MREILRKEAIHFMKQAMIFLAMMLGITGALDAQSGYFSEIKMDFTGLTSLLPPSPILTPGAGNASYLICAYVSQVPADTVGANLNWIDESGNPETAVLVSAPESGETGGCAAIRNKANTTPTIQATGYYSDDYDIYVVGLGFWNVGPDKQGGITEPISASFPGQTSTLEDTVLLAPEDYETYLVAASLTTYSSEDNVTATLIWNDDYGLHLKSITSSSEPMTNSILLPIRSMKHTYFTVWTTGTISDKYDLYIRGVKFGTPAQGTGPLAYYGRTFLDWVNPVDYSEGAVPAGMWLMSATGEYATPVEQRLTLNGFPVSATTGTVPAVSGVGVAYEPTGGNEWFATICGSYVCPEYSAEFNLVVF
jgi:hypothetical protein